MRGLAPFQHLNGADVVDSLLNQIDPGWVGPNGFCHVALRYSRLLSDGLQPDGNPVIEW